MSYNLNRQGTNFVQTCSVATATDNIISHSQSINTLPSLHDCIISEDLLAGYRSEGRMSNVRRFFCLFVVFDLLFIGLLWIICIMLKGEDLTVALKMQIYYYNVHTSLFDVVLAALCRFVVLLLFYGLLYMNHWFVISLSTFLSCVFLIGKVFVFNWPHTTQPVFEVLLIIVSFLLCWGETWFLDCRVLPQETTARRYIITNVDSERAPLIQNFLNGLPSVCTESVGNFYSPCSSPDGSVYDITNSPRHSPILPEQESIYKITAAKALQEAVDLLYDKSWKLEKQSDLDTVYSIVNGKHTKIFKLTAYIEVESKYLLDELFNKVENIPNWNPTLLEYKKIEVIDDHTDISYQITAEAAGGIISSRDFVTIRHWAHINNCYIIAYTGINHPLKPITDNYIRGDNGTGCWAIESDPNNSDKCYFQWIVNTNLHLKKWLPQTIKDKAFINIMFDYIKNLRLYINKNKKGKF